VTQSREELLAEGRRMFILAAATLERDVLLHGLTEDEQDVLVGAVLNGGTSRNRKGQRYSIR
jgi:hypothetical protein